MKLTKEQKKILLEWNYSQEDLEQIEEATSVTTYKLYRNDKLVKKIGIREAIRLLGIETYLSGISRSAFHFTACRHINSLEYIMFDSSKLFA